MGCHNRLENYGKNTTIHGFGQVSDKSLHFLERFAWFVTILISGYGMSVIFLASYDAYDKNPISFVTETAYLRWNTTFPAVTACQLMNPDIFGGSVAKDNILRNYISEMVFFTGSCYSCSKNCSECPKLDVKALVKKYRKTCKDLLSTCIWTGKPFDCCEK